MKQGDTASAELQVREQDTARAIALAEGDEFPEVFATSRMIALMELAAARCMQSEVAEGQLSVGVDVQVKHTAATPVGARVEAQARFTGRDGKLYCFEVVARDQGGQVGHGTHSRAIVSVERLLAGAAQRNPA